MATVSVHDVVKYILEKTAEPLSGMKLQKLLYYCQAWSLVWDEAPLFEEEIEAWKNGPVVRAVYDEHKGKFSIDSWPLGDASHLSQKQRETIDAVLSYYGHRSAQWLSDLTHMEDPWKDARGKLGAYDRGYEVITHEKLAEYYSSLPPDGE